MCRNPSSTWCDRWLWLWTPVTRTSSTPTSTRSRLGVTVPPRAKPQFCTLVVCLHLCISHLDGICFVFGGGWGGGVYCCPTSRKNTVLHPCGMCLHYVSVTEMGFDLSLVGCVCVCGGAVRWGGGRDTWTGWMMPSVGLFNLTDSGSLLFGRRVPA